MPQKYNAFNMKIKLDENYQTNYLEINFVHNEKYWLYTMQNYLCYINFR